jgi:hypothetical protein
MKDDFCGNYFREPRNNAMREGFKIKDGMMNSRSARSSFFVNRSILAPNRKGQFT